MHRPVYLDYVGVKKFDETGEVVGERRFLGLFSSAAYTECVTRIPVLREKADAVIEGAGFAPMSHTGKALMDVLETYPRDELFQTPVEELLPIAEARCCTRASGGSCGCSSAATSTAATSRAWSTCRATATTPGPRADAAILKTPARRRDDRVHRPGQRVVARPAALRRPAARRRA